MLKQLSLKSKLLFTLLAVAFCSIVVVSLQSYRTGERIITQSVHSQLTSLRAARASQIERYFQEVRNQLEILAEDYMIVDAMKEFDATYGLLNRQAISDKQALGLNEYYQQQFLPRLQKNSEGVPVLEHYLPQAAAARYLQYHYIANNPNDLGKKQLLISADDGSMYDEVHQRYHPFFEKVIEKFGYYDLFLVSMENSEIVYSVYKETDFATSLADGPYSNSNFADVVRRTHSKNDRGLVSIADYQAYRPSYAAPAAFVAVPIYDQQTVVGVLAMQLSTHTLDAVMTGDQHWQRDGLGDSGQVYLVGKDGLMRSESRALLEDPKQYLAALRTHKTSPEVVSKIERLNTSVLVKPVLTEAVDDAQKGQAGTRVVQDYRHVPVLSSYSPLNITGLDWNILAEIDLQEVNRPLVQFKKQLLISSAIIICLTTLAAMFFAHLLAKPIQQLEQGVSRVSSGETDFKIDIERRDEFGRLGHAFNDMVENIHQQRQIIDEKDRQNEALLLNILPTAIAKRVQDGEEQIADRFPSVSVLFAALQGFGDHADALSPNEAVKQLNEIITGFDEIADKDGIEKVKSVGYTYVAASGLSMPRVDHAKRQVDYAEDMFDVIRQFNRVHQSNIGLRVGIHSGPVIAGIVGQNKFVYDLWGKTVTLADQLRSLAKTNEIWVSQEVFDRLVDKDRFSQHQTEIAETSVTVWRCQSEIQRVGANDSEIVTDKVAAV